MGTSGIDFELEDEWPVDAEKPVEEETKVVVSETVVDEVIDSVVEPITKVVGND